MCARSGLRIGAVCLAAGGRLGYRSSVTSQSDPSVALVIAAAVLAGCALGAYVGIARAKAPLGAPESQQTLDRRQRFKEQHLGHARLALVGSAVLLVAALVYVIVAHAG